MRYHNTAKCHDSISSLVSMCKIKDGANIKSGCMLGIRLQPSDRICDLTTSRGKWYPRYFLCLMVLLPYCLLWVHSGFQNYMTGFLPQIVEGFGEDLLPVVLHIRNSYHPQIKRQWSQDDTYEQSELEREHLSDVPASGFPDEKSILLGLCTICVLRTRYLEKWIKRRYCLIWLIVNGVQLLPHFKILWCCEAEHRENRYWWRILYNRKKNWRRPRQSVAHNFSYPTFLHFPSFYEYRKRWIHSLGQIPHHLTVRLWWNHQTPPFSGKFIWGIKLSFQGAENSGQGRSLVSFKGTGSRWGRNESQNRLGIKCGGFVLLIIRN